VTPPLRQRGLVLGTVVLLVTLCAVRLGVDRAVLAHAGSVRHRHAVTDRAVPTIERLRVGVTGAVWLARSALTAAIVAWMARARALVQTYDCGLFRSDPAFAVSGWFIPPINLMAPYLLMADVWTASHPSRPPDAVVDRLKVPRRITGWWLLLLLSLFLGIMEIADRMHGGSTWAPFDMDLDYAMTTCQIVSAVLLAWTVVPATGFIEQRARVTSPA
jgi:uncharacterized protein DUF4328